MAAPQNSTLSNAAIQSILTLDIKGKKRKKKISLLLFIFFSPIYTSKLPRPRCSSPSLNLKALKTPKMHITTPILALTTLAAAATSPVPNIDAWLIPERLKWPAVYEWTFVPRKKGQQTTLTQFHMDHTLNITSKLLTTQLPMPATFLKCHPLNPYNNDTINRAHGIIAMELFMNWCERYQPKPGGVVAALYGDMSWFLCGFDRSRPREKHRSCSRDEALEAGRILDKYCGYGNPGEVKMSKWQRSYGRGIQGTSICANVLYQLGVDD